MISARTISRLRPAGPSSAGRPSWRAIAATAATCPCGSDRVIANSLTGAHQRLALQRRLERVDRLGGQHRQVGHGLVAHRGPVAVGAPQVGRRVLAALALLVHVRLPNSDYVDPALFTWHSMNHIRFQRIREDDTP